MKRLPEGAGAGQWVVGEKRVWWRGGRGGYKRSCSWFWRTHHVPEWSSDPAVPQYPLNEARLSDFIPPSELKAFTLAS